MNSLIFTLGAKGARQLHMPCGKEAKKWGREDVCACQSSHTGVKNEWKAGLTVLGEGRPGLPAVSRGDGAIGLGRHAWRSFSLLHTWKESLDTPRTHSGL